MLCGMHEATCANCMQVDNEIIRISMLLSGCIWVYVGRSGSRPPRRWHPVVGGGGRHPSLPSCGGRPRLRARARAMAASYCRTGQQSEAPETDHPLSLGHLTLRRVGRPSLT